MLFSFARLVRGWNSLLEACAVFQLSQLSPSRFARRVQLTMPYHVFSYIKRVNWETAKGFHALWLYFAYCRYMWNMKRFWGNSTVSPIPFPTTCHIAERNVKPEARHCAVGCPRFDANNLMPGNLRLVQPHFGD